MCKNPCLDCTDRFSGCTTRCDTGIKESEKRKARSEIINQAKMDYIIPNCVQVTNFLRAQHKKGRQI